MADRRFIARGRAAIYGKNHGFVSCATVRPTRAPSGLQKDPIWTAEGWASNALTDGIIQQSTNNPLVNDGSPCGVVESSTLTYPAWVRACVGRRVWVRVNERGMG